MDNTNLKKIALVDDNIANLTIGKKTLIGKYHVFTVPSGEKLFQLFEKIKPDLILLDIEMPGMNGYDVIKRLKADPETEEIPVIFLTGKNDPLNEIEGLSYGAIDYILKPFSPPILLKRIENHMIMIQQRIELNDQKEFLKNYNQNLRAEIEKQTERVLELQNSVLRTMSELVEYRDDVTGGHIERTQEYLKILLMELVRKDIYSHITSSWKLTFLLQSSQLHDVGKISISDSILKKAGKLTTEEFNIMKTHTTFGEKVIERIEENTAGQDFLSHAKIFAGTHHEKWDGSGYPRGLQADEIPLQGRLMAIADVYDALVSTRPYKKPFSHSDACDIIVDGKGKHFDPILVDLFISKENDFRQVLEYVATRNYI
ncbi:MAG: response regulator [Oscillospiraceae bacterium]|jgi:putative two-component system response regulator|nr:response regulator [Oscillospiraceae bacterium]